MIKNSHFYSDLAEISAILPTHGFNILTKFDEDWSKNVNFFSSILLGQCNFLWISLYIIYYIDQDFQMTSIFS